MRCVSPRSPCHAQQRAAQLPIAYRLAEVAAWAWYPVIGIGQAAYAHRALQQWDFSVVTTLSISLTVIERTIEADGYGAYLARLCASEVPVLEADLVLIGAPAP